MRQVFLKDSGWEHSSEKILPDFHMAKEKPLPKEYGVNVLSKKECIFRRALEVTKQVCMKSRNTVIGEFRMKSSV